jgi:hypothetical protein
MMEIGMLWFDNDPELDVFIKVQKAAAYYHKKYGKTPNLCYLHPSMVIDKKVDTGGITLQADDTIQPNHFWIGIHSKTSY